MSARNQKYRFRLRSEDEELFIDDTRHRNLLLGLQETTSAHGISHVYQAKGKAKKIFWIVMTLIAFIALVVHLAYVISSFFQYNVTVKMEILQNYEMKFPSVTICNMNPVKSSALQSSSIMKRKRRKKRELGMPASTASGSCDPNQVFVDYGLCYGLVTDTQRNYATAEALCSSTYGGSLAVIDTQDKFDFLKSSTIFAGSSSSDPYWIYLEKDKWANKVNAERTFYTSKGHYNKDKTGDCASGSVDDDYLWTAMNCKDKHNALCMRMDRCPLPVYVHSDGTKYCFFLYTTDYYKFKDAEEFCTYLSPQATLPILDTTAKMNHVKSISTQLVAGMTGYPEYFYMHSEGNLWYCTSGTCPTITNVNFDSSVSQPIDDKDNIRVKISDPDNKWFNSDGNDESLVVCMMTGLDYLGETITYQPTTTDPPTTSVEETTTVNETTTSLPTTVEPTTTVSEPTTYIELTSVISSTSVDQTIITKEKTISSEQTSAQESTSTLPSTLVQQTTSLEITTTDKPTSPVEKITSLVSSTTEKPQQTTSVEIIAEESTPSTEQTTSSEPNSTEQTTTTKESTSPVKPTTYVEETSTEHETTTPLPTTIQPTTSVSEPTNYIETTSVKPSTSVDQTTTRETTISSEQTIAQESTSTLPSTLVQEITSIEITTTDKPTSPVEKTTSLVSSTTEKPQQTTSVEITTADKPTSTVKKTTSLVSGTTEKTITVKQPTAPVRSITASTSDKHTTRERPTTNAKSSIAVELSSNDLQTTTEKTDFTVVINTSGHPTSKIEPSATSKTTNKTKLPPTTSKSVTETTATTTAPVTTTTVNAEFPEKRAPREDFKQEEKLYETVAELSIEEKVALGYSMTELLVDCQYEGADCLPEKDFVLYNHPLHGNCYTFNSGWNDSFRQLTAHHSGRRYGLIVTLNIGEYEYSKQFGGSAGARIVVHPYQSMAHPGEQGVMARPGELTSIGIKQVRVGRLPDPYGNCTKKEKDIGKDVYNEQYPATKYSKAGCYKTCFQRNLIEACNCSDLTYPSYGKAFDYKEVPPCSIDNPDQDLCKYGITDKYIKGKLACNAECPDLCLDEYYDLSLSTSSWPSAVHQDDILQRISSKIQGLLAQNDSSIIPRNLLQVEVFYEEFNYQAINELPAYLPEQFASDCGGILGLWLGFSVLTIFEFFESGLDCLVLALLKRRKSKNNASVRTVSECSSGSSSSIKKPSLEDVECAENEMRLDDVQSPTCISLHSQPPDPRDNNPVLVDRLDKQLPTSGNIAHPNKPVTPQLPHHQIFPKRLDLLNDSEKGSISSGGLMATPPPPYADPKTQFFPPVDF